MRSRWAFALVALAIGAAPATAFGSDAGPTPVETADTWNSCHAPVFETPFLFAGDTSTYVLAPAGSFEGDATGWQLTGAGSFADGNDPFPLRDVADQLTATPDSRVLSLPEGSSATSPLMCVDLTFPTFRFALQSLSDDNSGLRVEVQYPDSANPRWRKVSLTDPDGTDWKLTDPLDLLPEKGASFPGSAGSRFA